MTGTAATPHKTNEFISKRLRLSGLIIMASLVVEDLSLVWNHPLSFVAFLGLGGLLLSPGIVLHL
jgi:hypothetical protein